MGPHFGFRIPYETSRGCAFNCSFCGFCKNHPLEIKSIVKVVDDIKLLTETYGSRWINFVNSEINISNDYMHDLCDAIIGSKIDINWHSYATPYRLDRDLIDKMKESGCHSLYFGAETASNKLLRNMNKPFLAEEMESVIRWTHNAGIETRLFFIAGYPHESENDIKATLEFIKRNKFYITSYEIAHFRVEYGTDIFLNPAKYGIRILRPNFMNPVKWCYEFDEINGLKWKDKVKEIDRSYRRLSQVLEPKSRISLLVDGLKSKISSLCLNR
ncbi:MAG: radical SAM protein [Candidatus Omnitrophica bacterium]|nr:radical SAM protein [Candidatus Omnitrophota bacterium]